MNSNDIAGVCAMLCVFGIPIVAILTSHQRKMAMILHENARATAPNAEAQMLREEIQELKALVHQQSIALDSLARPLPASERVEQRVG